MPALVILAKAQAQIFMSTSRVIRLVSQLSSWQRQQTVNRIRNSRNKKELISSLEIIKLLVWLNVPTNNADLTTNFFVLLNFTFVFFCRSTTALSNVFILFALGFQSFISLLCSFLSSPSHSFLYHSICKSHFWFLI